MVQQVTNTISFLQSVQFVTDSIGWAVGGVGRVIFTNTSGQIVSLTNITNQEPDRFKLYQNYPNPFNSETNIQFEITKNDYYIFEIYDIIGRKLLELMNEQKNPGIYKIKARFENFSSGTYIYKLYSTSFEISKKMVIIR